MKDHNQINKNHTDTLSQKSVNELVNIILRKDDEDRTKNVMIKELRTELNKNVLAYGELKKDFQTMKNKYKAMFVKFEVLQKEEQYYRKSLIFYRLFTGIMLGVIIILVSVYVYL